MANRPKVVPCYDKNVLMDDVHVYAIIVVCHHMTYTSYVMIECYEAM